MRTHLLGAIPLALTLAFASVSVAQAKSHHHGKSGTAVKSAPVMKAAKHKHRHASRRSKSYGFAWYFANMDRIESRHSCAGNRVVATWYQSGRRTATGALFNPNGHTAAHRTLPFGTRLTVTNPRNGQSVVVTVNDRGPFTHGVSIDLARGAARAIGMMSTQQVCLSAT